MHVVALAILTTILLGQPGVLQPNAIRDRARVQNRVGWENMQVEQFEAAAKSFQQAIDIDRDYEDAYYGLGRAQMALKRYEAAIASYTKCRDIYLAQAGRRFSTAQEAQRYRRDRLLEIDEALRQLQTGPQTPTAQERIRQLQETRRQQQETISRGERITIDSTVPSYVLLALGSAYFRAGRVMDAEREYKAAIEANPQSGEAHQNLAVVYLMTQRYADAERALSAAKKTGFKVNPALEQEIQDKKKRT